jgi:hypothetical protein
MALDSHAAGHGRPAAATTRMDFGRLLAVSFHVLEFDILPQPDNTTCGPTCLQALYRFHGDEVPLDEVIETVPKLEDGGTLAVLLGCHALTRGYDAQIITANLQVFDPSWFTPDAPPLADRLARQMEVKPWPKLQLASKAYLEFLRLGGKIRMRDLTSSLIRKYLKRQLPILTGLSATFLYRCAREYGPNCDLDDIRGQPAGHFVVLCGYDKKNRQVLVADPFLAHPFGPDHYYQVNANRVIRAILLGVLTYDANLLIIKPKAKPPSA